MKRKRRKHAVDANGTGPMAPKDPYRYTLVWSIPMLAIGVSFIYLAIKSDRKMDELYGGGIKYGRSSDGQVLMIGLCLTVAALWMTWTSIKKQKIWRAAQNKSDTRSDE